MNAEDADTVQSELLRAVEEHRQQVLAKRDVVATDRAKRVPPAMADYAWVALEQRLANLVRKAAGMDEVTVQVDQIDRATFGGDIALKVPSLLKQGGPKRFISEFQPLIAELLGAQDMADLVAGIELKGMYINITLADEWLLRSAEQVVQMGARFGLNDTLSGQNIIVDYSSPNVAKMLHAGHIRSTITGEVLSNIYDASGATVFRVNHINDFGGFGFLLEGYRRFGDKMPAELTENGKLLEVYAIRRTLERVVETGKDPADWEAAERETILRYFPEVTDAASARAAFGAYTRASDERFKDLEEGKVEEVALWKKMVEWSLEEFQKFYDLLNINIDFVIGESFYYHDGLEAVETAKASGRAEVFTQQQVDAALAEIDNALAAGQLTEGEADFQRQGVTKDLGAAVVKLGSGERLVLLRSDGRSIYATRDVGAIARRNAFFAPDKVVYVVGQEQRSHFKRLFEAADQLGLTADGLPELLHLYFGFYIDQETGKKLSSRASVSNVLALLEQAELYFLKRLSERGGMTEADRAKAARELTVGSLIFNDLKQDIKGTVDIDVSNLASTIEGFERAGGAYSVYSACRARSILRRHGREPKTLEAIGAFELSMQEVKLLLMLQHLPMRVADAARKANPTHLLRHLLDIAMEYNSYYTAAPVLTPAGANEARVLITKAVQLALVNGLAICHIDTPESI